MSLEAKTYDVLPEEEQTLLNIMYSFGWTLKSRQRVSNTSSRPTAAFTYSGVTLIHSETETDEYTTLTFERETNISNYRRIVSLENEFWELLPHMTAKRPLEPPPMLHFQEWMRTNKPKVVSFGQKFMSAVISGVIYLCILLKLLYGAVSLALPMSIPLALLTAAIYGKIRNAAALRNPNSEGYQKARNLYSEYEANYKEQLAAPEMYDYAQDRVPRIIAESKRLLDEP